MIPLRGGVGGVIGRVCSRRARRKHVLVLRMYLDESGFHDGTVAMAVGGYLSADDRWKSFEDEWCEALSRERVECFHMTDFENRYGEFSGWSNERRVRVFRTLADIINRHAGPGISYGIRESDYKALVPRSVAKSTQEWMWIAFAVLWNRCLADLRAAVLEEPDVEASIALVFDRNQRMAPLIIGGIQGIIEKHPDHYGWISSVSFEDKREFVPIQAADILAYESFKVVENISTGNKRPIRKSLKALKPSVAKIAFLDREALMDDIAIMIGAPRW